MNPWKPAVLHIREFGPEFDRNLSVESRTGSVRYTVNLHRFTCTCPDFQKRRSSFPIGKIGRSCKHLRDVVLSLDSETFTDELTRVIFKSEHGPYDRIWFAPGPDGEIIALGVSEGKVWVNLFIRRGPSEPYDRYGYNLADGRWAFDSEPPGKDGIMRLLAQLPSGSR